LVGFDFGHCPVSRLKMKAAQRQPFIIQFARINTISTITFITH